MWYLSFSLGIESIIRNIQTYETRANAIKETVSLLRQEWAVNLGIPTVYQEKKLMFNRCTDYTEIIDIMKEKTWHTLLKYSSLLKQ